MNKWLPIETAPRDDTVIVAVEATERNKTFANWRDSVPVYIDEHGVIYDLGTSKPESGIASGNYRATHWQPLPMPPGESDHTHSTQDDYEHFLAYSGLDHSPAIQYAYFHGADVGMDRPVGVGYAGEVIPGTSAALAALGRSAST